MARQAPDARSTEGTPATTWASRCRTSASSTRARRAARGAQIAEEELDDVDDVARAIVNLGSV